MLTNKETKKYKPESEKDTKVLCSFIVIRYKVY